MKFLQIILFILWACLAFSQDYSIRNYVVDIEINEDGTLLVQEQLDVFFSEKRRGIYRNIPTKYIINGKTQKLKVTDVTVQDHKFLVKKEGKQHVIRIGDKNVFLEGNQTYNFSYTVSNAFVFNEYNTEFQHNLITDWDSTIDRFSYSISLPDTLTMNSEDYLIMTGDEGEQNRHVSIKKENQRLYGRSLKQILPNENVTVYLNLPPDYINRPIPPVPLHKRDKWWTLPLGLLLALFAFFRKARKIDYSTFGHRTSHFPPEGFSPAMVGAYYDQKINTEDVISLIPYWAEQGHIKILKGEEDLFFDKKSSLPLSAPEYQKVLFENIFKTDELVMLSDLKEKMYTHVYKVKRHIHKELLGRNLYDEKEYKLFHNGLSLILGIIIIISAIVFAAKTKFVISGIILALVGLALFIMHFITPKRSEKGIKLQEHLESLRNFLDKGTGNNIQDLLKSHPNYFEQMYPYAIAFGIDKTWVNKMKEYDVHTPSWYDYQTGYSASQKPSFNNFTHEFKVQEITSVFTSAPASSSGGSSSRGSFSGGAGGGFGGGGGSW